MTLIFQGSDKPSIGVEIELQILDPSTFDLSPQSEKLLETCEKQAVERVKVEIHQSMVEVDSEISVDVKQCRKFLNKRFEAVDEIARSLGIQLGVTGTHPFQRWKDRQITNQVRYQNLHEKFQWLARRMNIYGMHVHIGVPTGDHALEISQAMIQYLPHLLALSANSPFWQGIDTGMQSSRVNIIEAFPLAGLPPNFSKWQEFDHYYQTLHRVGAVSSFKDLYWYIRPNLSYGTIEFRICDAMSTLSETMAVVALTHCLVVWISDHLQDRNWKPTWTQEQHWIAPENQWIAARDGLEGMIITNLQGKRQKIADAILELVETLSPIAKRLNCKEELDYLNHIILKGNGAQRQRATYNETSSLEQVVMVALDEFQSDLRLGCKLAINN